MEDNKRIENAEETTQSLKGGSSFREKLRRDNSWIGLLIGLGCPAVIFGILSGLLAIIENYTGKIDVINIQKIILLSIIPNLFILRYTLVKLKHDLTGRGIMGATLVIAFIFIILEFWA